MSPFVPSRDKLEAVNRISALTGNGPEELGPGSKERKRVLENVVAYLQLPVSTSANKVALGRGIVESLGGTWTPGCYSTGYTITLRGLDLVLELAQAETARRQAARKRPLALSVAEEANAILDACVHHFARLLTIHECVSEMREREDSNWAQSEWPGFYFESTARGACMAIAGGEPGPRVGSVPFDYKLVHVWDFKAHSRRMASGAMNHQAILNDAVAMERCIEEYGGLGFVVGHGDAFFDDDGSSHDWFVAQRRDAGKKSGPPASSGRSRAIKAAFRFTRLDAIFLRDRDVLDWGVHDRWLKRDFQVTLRQPGGAPRRAKYQLNTRRMPADLVVASRHLDEALY